MHVTERERRIRNKRGIKKEAAGNSNECRRITKQFIGTNPTKMLPILISWYQKKPENRVSHVIIGKNM